MAGPLRTGLRDPRRFRDHRHPRHPRATRRRARTPMPHVPRDRGVRVRLPRARSEAGPFGSMTPRGSRQSRERRGGPHPAKRHDRTALSLHLEAATFGRPPFAHARRQGAPRVPSPPTPTALARSCSTPSSSSSASRARSAAELPRHPRPQCHSATRGRSTAAVPSPTPRRDPFIAREGLDEIRWPGREVLAGQSG